jgi:DNA-binding transcriptional LysR family regulator
MTLDQLRTFAAVADYEHVTRAADELGLSQPAVSHQLKALEAVLGVPLLERVGRGVRLTSDGKALVPIVDAALAACRSVQEAAAARTGLIAGDLIVAASNTIGIYRMPAWLAGFLEQYPGVDVRVQLVNTWEAIHALREAHVDCALVEGPGSTEGLDELPVEADELVVVAAPGHPLAALRVVGTEDLAGHRYLAREAGSGTETLAAELLGPAYRCGPVLELGFVDAVRSAALTGLGYAVLSLAAIAEDLDAGRLVPIRTGRPGLRRTLRALKRRGGQSRALEVFWAHLESLSTVRPTE